MSVAWIEEHTERCLAIVKLMADGVPRTTEDIGKAFKRTRQQMSQTVNAMRDLRVMKVVDTREVVSRDRAGRVRSRSKHQVWELVGEPEAMVSAIEDRRAALRASYNAKKPGTGKKKEVVVGERTVLPDGGILTVNGNCRRYEFGNSKRKVANDGIGNAWTYSRTGCAAALMSEV